MMKMTEIESRSHCVCFTGHRPEKLKLSEDAVKAGLEQQIVQAIANGYTTFITGMAPGVDLWAGKIVADLRDNGLPIKLVAVNPYPSFGKKFEPEWNSLHQEITERADLVESACKVYNKGCFMARNKWMVDHSNLVIAVFNGEKGGTKNTIDYASKQGVRIRYI